MKRIKRKFESFLKSGGIKRDIFFLIISGTALICSILRWESLPFDMAWIAIVICGIPIVLEVIIGLITEFDIKADVLVSLVLIDTVCIKEDFTAGEVAFIMQFDAVLEDLTVAKAREGLEKLVHLTPQTAKMIESGAETIISAQEM